MMDASRFRFAFSQNGGNWTSCGKEVEVGYLEVVRIDLTAGGKRRREKIQRGFAWILSTLRDRE